MTPDPSLPLNRLEVAIVEARAGRLPVSTMLRVLLASELVVPSGAPVEPDGKGLRPVLFDRPNGPVAACFSLMARAEGLERLAPYALYLPARAWIAGMADGCGLVINPGQPFGFEMDADGLRRAVARLGS